MKFRDAYRDLPNNQLTAIKLFNAFPKWPAAPGWAIRQNAYSSRGLVWFGWPRAILLHALVQEFLHYDSQEGGRLAAQHSTESKPL